MFHIEVRPPQCQQEGFYLIMNPVYDRAESVRAFGPFTTAQSAVDYHNSQLLRDENGQPTRKNEEGDPFIRSFMPGPLANMNALDPYEMAAPQGGTFGHGIFQLRPVRAMEWFKHDAVVPPLL